MVNRINTIVAAVVILATTSTASECGYRQACSVSFRGLLMESGRVTDVAIASCDPADLPQEHYIEAWIEHRTAPAAERLQVTNKHEAFSQQVPGSPNAGFKAVEVPLSTVCVEGEYRSAAYIEGLSEPVTDYPEGREFAFTIISSKRRAFSVGDCVAGVTR